MFEQPDPFDPTTWDELFRRQDEIEYRIYADDTLETYAIVDRVDYQWAVQWRWHENKPMKKRRGTKRYLCRNSSNGRRWAPKFYLHVEIMKRSKRRRPSKHHVLVDHRDGKEWNCRRPNLRWTTHKGNSKNTVNRGGRRRVVR